MKAALHVLALWLTIASAWSGTVEPYPYRTLLAHCKGLDSSFSCARAIEAGQAKGAVRIRFEREGKALRVHTGKGAASFIDDDTEGDDSIHYSYLTYLPSLQMHVVHLQHWEGNSYMAVHNPSGAIAYLDGFPNVAPNAQWFVSISSAGESGYYPNSVEVWRVGKGGLASEFRYSPDANDWSPERATWLSSQNIKLRGICTPNAAKSTKCIALVQRIGRQWRLTHDR